MSTLFIFILAALVIFWRSPFKTSNHIKNLLRPAILMVILIILLFIGALHPISKKKQPQKTAYRSTFDESWNNPLVE